MLKKSFLPLQNPARPVTLRLVLLLGLLLLLMQWGLAFEYKTALPGYRFSFPRDHASHPDYKTEWWYYTGHLDTADGRRFGYELTFFRVGLPQTGQQTRAASPWKTDNVYAAHFALSDENRQRFFYSEKLNRPGLQVAGALPDTYYVWNELWLAELLGDQHVLHAGATSGDRGIRLLLTPEKPPVVHGRDGVSQKASCTGCASHYYSMTRLRTSGLLFLDGQAIPVTGLSWMDHEFGSNQLGKNQTGWDWFSIQLADRTEIMLYLLRLENGQPDPNSSGTIVYPGGRSRHLALKDFAVIPSGKTWRSEATGGIYPMGWHIRIPSEDMTLTVTPAFENQELSTTGSTGVAYWEGSSRVQGTRTNRSLSGQAYVEMTGYAQKFQQRI